MVLPFILNSSQPAMLSLLLNILLRIYFKSYFLALSVGFSSLVSSAQLGIFDLIINFSSYHNQKKIRIKM